MGDIALAVPDKVKDKMVQLIEEGLRRSGYAVGNGPAGENTVVANVEGFWAWFTPGMWSVGFESRIQARITLKKGGKTVSVFVQGRGENRGQVASDANWQLAYSRAFEDFLNNFRLAIQNEGF
jgi:hypothetical protein